MKKQILACAVAAAFATGAVAADVSIYGTVDTGFTFGNSKVTGSKSENSFKMGTAISGPNRWGVKGGEDLGNGYSVSFDLQSGFESDTGAMADGDRLFSRETRLTVAGPFGELSFGRMGGLASSAGTYDIFQGYSDIYDGGWATDNGAIGGLNFFYDRGRCDNMVTYATPTMAGVKGYAQYSFKVDNNGKGTEGKNSSKRYAGVGLTYENGPLAAVIVYDTILNQASDTVSKKDGRAVSVGGSYDFGAAKLFVAYQYGENENQAGGVNAAGEKVKVGEGDNAQEVVKYGKQLDGHNFHLGVSVPVCAGTLNLAGYYTRAKATNDSAQKVKTFDVAATYVYPLSKRTSVYAGVGYAQIKNTLTAVTGSSYEKTKAFDAAIGLAHSF